MKRNITLILLMTIVVVVLFSCFLDVVRLFQYPLDETSPYPPPVVKSVSPYPAPVVVEVQPTRQPRENNTDSPPTFRR